MIRGLVFKILLSRSILVKDVTVMIARIGEAENRKNRRLV